MKMVILVKNGTIQEIRCSGHGVDLAVVDLDSIGQQRILGQGSAEEEFVRVYYGNFPVHHNPFPLKSMVKDYISQRRKA